ncbi:hypothetical protein VFPPC_16996 [Pochonia chlamydosporia 170]|uniref:Uncharacterized protein n=1 Tax=Pochonia chlamydosporia 170 TaxID=1380566 RepID=A0A179EYP8_METCM|nr:hypothetical protein VFPPC_16996 [Pochonia chlamydosporia 170]OAQ58314.1 hypothetical protein VFPPC_16996 [Pochonia chlamydosporia 170]
MAYGTTTDLVPYFDTSWAVLSTIGICLVFIGVMVAGIRGKVSALILVPIVVSAGCAVGNGVHYYEAFLECPPINQAVALVSADIAYTIQEAGLPFYGYIILTGFLAGSSRIIFLTLFWSLMVVILAIRTAIIVINVRVILNRHLSLALYSTIISRLHIGYFLPIAITESISAIFLLKTFRSTLQQSTSCGLRGGKLFRHLMRSTEIRVATLALVGIARTITFSFNMIGNNSPVSKQLDTFVYSVGALFPIVLFIDIIATRQAYDDDSNVRCNTFGGPAAVDQAAGSSDRPATKSTCEHHEDEIFASRHVMRNDEVLRQQAV